MESKQIIKSVSVAILGGAIALGGSFLFKDEPKIVEKVIIEQPSSNLVNYSGITLSSQNMDFTVAAEGTVNSVVHILTETTAKMSSDEEAFYEFFYGKRRPQRAQRGTGSGVIISDDGYIVTNNHVVAGADKVNVTLNDNKQYEATVVGTDPSTDLAVIKIEEEGLTGIELGNSDDVKIGEWVLAVGNPFNLTSTVTAGIVSAKSRSINIMQQNSAKNLFPIESFIQTDAAVNPGNSGGALVNTAGELVGINTAIASKTGSYSGYSFAVPVNLMKKVTADLIKYGVVQRAFIGVSIQEMNQDLANELSVSNTEGVYVNGLSDGGAAKDAGIEVGDVIIKIEDKEVKSVASLQEQVGNHQPGDKINVGLYRSGNYKIIPVTLKNLDGTTDVVSKPKELEKNELLGAKLVIPSKKELSSLGIDNGVKVESLSKGKLRNIGIEKGFIITKVDKTKISSEKELEKILNKNKGEGVLIEGIYPNGMKAFYGVGM